MLHGTTINATDTGAACPQPLGNPLPQFEGIYGNTTSISEDCLTVRISRPPGTKKHEILPVMVYLFGAGYAFGSIYDDVAYDPEGLVRENAAKALPIMYVAISYRIGFFGFSASEALRDEDNLNAGLMDQYLCQWIQNHIESFRGDKDDVTIFGEDVGWTNVHLQLTSYGGNDKPLFKRAVLQLSENHTAQLTEILGCSSPTGDGSAEIECLRSLSVDTINTAAIEFSLNYTSLGGIGTFRPKVPSPFIPDTPSKLLATGRFRKGVDILVGWNENDGFIIVPQTTNSLESFIAAMQGLLPGLPGPNMHALESFYPESEFLDYPKENVERNFFRASQAARDAFFTCPSLRLVHAWGSHASESRVFVFALNTTVFAVDYARFNRSFLGIDHFSDMPYVVDHMNMGGYASVASQTDYDVASRMAGSWAAFAHYGQPTISGLSDEELVMRNLTFPGWVAGEGYIRVLGGPRDGMFSIDQTYNESLKRRCGF
ncbi:carboxylesterase family protein [Xylariaceae sp. FL0662B]|nr:carboxylesterase family protein [Xylariaceae sp. FL0662B]